MSKKEGKHYKRKKKKDKNIYSLRSLVEEITGVKEGDEGFDAARKSLERIVRAFKDHLGISKGQKTIITKDMKNYFVKVMKAFYEDEEYIVIVDKIKKNHELTIEEQDRLLIHLEESVAEELPEDEREKFIESMKWMNADEYYEKAEEIHDIISKDIKLVGDIAHYPTRLKYMDEYMKILKESLVAWRVRISLHTIEEEAFRRVIEKEPELLNGRILSHDNMTPEIMMKLINEMNLMNEERKEKTVITT